MKRMGELPDRIEWRLLLWIAWISAREWWRQGKRRRAVVAFISIITNPRLAVDFLNDMEMQRLRPILAPGEYEKYLAKLDK